MVNVGFSEVQKFLTTREVTSAQQREGEAATIGATTHSIQAAVPLLVKAPLLFLLPPSDHIRPNANTT
jgi:hypothetical protein